MPWPTAGPGPGSEDPVLFLLGSCACPKKGQRLPATGLQLGSPFPSCQPVFRPRRGGLWTGSGGEGAWLLLWGSCNLKELHIMEDK